MPKSAQRRRNRTQVIALLVLLAGLACAITLVVGRAAASDPALITDPNIGVPLPAEDVTKINDNYSANTETVAPETSADVESQATIEPVDTGLFPADQVNLPFPPGVISGNNVWIAQDSAALTVIVAGAGDGLDPPLPEAQRQGELLFFKQDYLGGDDELSVYKTPDANGSLTITSVSGGIVDFTTGGGGSGTFNTSSRALSMNP